MGSGTSLHRSRIRKDSYDYEGGNRGVIKRIPIEVKPRGRLGLSSVSSFGRKSKNGSLRNTFSFDLEHPDVDKVKREFEMYKMQKENEIANLEKKEQKLEIENKRMRTELQTLQQRVSKLRSERDAAVDAERQAMTRAATFENERDKVQRQFKIFRETKENEIQNILKAKRDLELKVGRNNLGNIDESESAIKYGLNDTSFGNVGDWWGGLESEPSMGSMTQLHHVPTPLNDLTDHIDMDGISEESSFRSMGIPEIQSSTIRLYLSISSDLHQELSNLLEHYIPKLRELCQTQGRYLLPIHFHDNDLDIEPDNPDFERISNARARQVQRSDIFVAFLSAKLSLYTAIEYRVAHISSPGCKPVIFAFKDCDSIDDSVNNLRNLVVDSGGCKVINYTGAMKVTAEVYTALERLLRIEIGLPLDQDQEQEPSGAVEDLSADSVFNNYEFVEHDSDSFCVGSVWDTMDENRQLEAFQFASESSCELELEKYYTRLSSHVSSAGPLPPLLVLGSDGSGKSLLLAKWIRIQQQQRPISGQILYHFVWNSQSCSADPTTMIRRLTAKLIQSLPSPPPVSGDPNRLVEEFPRWLEKVSSRTPGGVILVLDSIDRCLCPEKHLKWLLDPLPVDVRVIISANEETCLSAWKSWPTLHIHALTSRSVLDLVKNEMSQQGLTLADCDQSRILTQCRTSDMCNPLYAMVLSSEMCTISSMNRSDLLESLLSCPDCVFLYKIVLDNFCLKIQEHGSKYVKTILQYIYISRNGLSEDAIFGLVSDITWSDLAPILDALCDRHILAYQDGVYSIAHEQAREAVREKYLDPEGGDTTEMDSLRRDCVRYFSTFLNPIESTCRSTDELLWHLRHLNEKTRLRDCLRNLCVFMKLYSRGRYSELLCYWNFTGADRSAMAKELFDSAKRYERMVGIEYQDILTLPRIADLCEAIGQFLLDIGLFTQAVAPLQHALEIRETALDPDHPKVAQALHHLANLHAQWSKRTTAEALYKQALEIYESAFGENHPSVARELDSLAQLYRKQNRHELAEPLHQRAISIQRHLASITMRQSQNIGLQTRLLQLEELGVNRRTEEKTSNGGGSDKVSDEEKVNDHSDSVHGGETVMENEPVQDIDTESEMESTIKLSVVNEPSAISNKKRKLSLNEENDDSEMSRNSSHVVETETENEIETETEDENEIGIESTNETENENEIGIESTNETENENEIGIESTNETVNENEIGIESTTEPETECMNTIQSRTENSNETEDENENQISFDENHKKQTSHDTNDEIIVIDLE